MFHHAWVEIGSWPIYLPSLCHDSGKNKTILIIFVPVDHRSAMKTTVTAYLKSKQLLPLQDTDVKRVVHTACVRQA